MSSDRLRPGGVAEHLAAVVVVTVRGWCSGSGTARVTPGRGGRRGRKAGRSGQCESPVCPGAREGGADGGLELAELAGEDGIPDAELCSLRLALPDSRMLPGVIRYPVATPLFAGMPCRSLCRNGDLAAGVMVQHVRDGAGRLVERVGLVDDHPDLAGFEEPEERIQVLPVHGRGHENLDALLRLLESGEIRVVIDKTYPLD